VSNTFLIPAKEFDTEFEKFLPTRQKKYGAALPSRRRLAAFTRE
jgi:hypothetical protein